MVMILPNLAMTIHSARPKSSRCFNDVVGTMRSVVTAVPITPPFHII